MRIAMGLRLYVFGAMVTGLGLMYVYDQYDRASNYIEATGRIQQVEQTCYLAGKLDGKKYISDKIQCSVAEDMQKNHPLYKNWDLKRDLKLAVRFKSPLDGQPHVSELSPIWKAGDKVPKIGDDYKILASKSVAEKIRIF